MIVGAFISVGGVLAKQISSEWLGDTSSLKQLKDALIFIRDINGQEYWAISMGMSAISYVSVSLLGTSSSFNMDKLLNRGEYAVEGESKIINKDTQIGWKIFLMGEEFTKTDKIIYLLNYAWTGLWTIVFIVGTIYNLSNDVSNTSWMNFWKNYLYVHIVFSIFIIIWFTLGGLNDLKVMLTKLKTDYRDHQDDGWVTKEKN